jgi:hypothetical protein
MTSPQHLGCVRSLGEGLSPLTASSNAITPSSCTWGRYIKRACVFEYTYGYYELYEEFTLYTSLFRYAVTLSPPWHRQHVSYQLPDKTTKHQQASKQARHKAAATETPMLQLRFAHIDDWFAAVVKPSGVAVQGDKNQKDRTSTGEFIFCVRAYIKCICFVYVYMCTCIHMTCVHTHDMVVYK